MRCGLAATLLFGLGCGGEPANSATDEAVAACVSLASCFGASVTSCLIADVPHMTAQEIGCLAASATDCTRAGMCSPGETRLPGLHAPCVGGGSAQTCDGTNIVFCDVNDTDSQSCPMTAASGSTCVMTSTGGARCAFGMCNDDSQHCDGSVLVRCVDGVLEAHDCALLVPALECRQNPAGDFACGGAGPACSSGDPPHCEGNALVTCANGFQSRTDCSVGGASCLVPGDSSAPPYCGWGNPCDTSMPQARCDGPKLSFCAAGLRRTIDCAGAGFTGCSTSGVGDRCTR